MKHERKNFGKVFCLSAIALVLATVGFWDQISEAFGPMQQNESQCLICHRYHVEKWVCRSKVTDDIVTNEYSEWIDSFTPLDHQHVWLGHTAYNRQYWFGGTSIACGGIATIPRMFEQRENLGESEAQQLAAKFHQLVRDQSSQIDFSELHRFTKAIVEDPHRLLPTDTETDGGCVH